jgi:hypothetical protein
MRYVLPRCAHTARPRPQNPRPLTPIACTPITPANLTSAPLSSTLQSRAEEDLPSQIRGANEADRICAYRPR